MAVKEEEEENIIKTSSSSIVQAQDMNMMDSAPQGRLSGRRVRRQPIQQCKKTGNVVHCTQPGSIVVKPGQPSPIPPRPPPPPKPPTGPPPRPPRPPVVIPPQPEKPGVTVNVDINIQVKPDQGGRPQQGMVIPKNWGERCRQDQAWCQKFITELMAQGLMLYTMFPGLTPPKVNQAQRDACRGNQACLDKLEKDGQERLVKSALDAVMHGQQMRSGEIGADGSGMSGGLIAAIVVIVCLALAVLAYFCCIRRGRGKKTVGGSRGSLKSRRSIAGKSSKKLTSNGGVNRVKSSKSKRSLKSKRGSALKSKKSSIKASRSGMASSSRKSLKSAKRGGSQKYSRNSFSKGSQKSMKSKKK